jgi:hypothetical protein
MATKKTEVWPVHHSHTVVFVRWPHIRGAYMKTHACVATVQCPFCGAVPGEPCKGTRGYKPEVHYARKDEHAYKMGTRKRPEKQHSSVDLLSERATALRDELMVCSTNRDPLVCERCKGMRVVWHVDANAQCWIPCPDCKAFRKP